MHMNFFTLIELPTLICVIIIGKFDEIVAKYIYMLVGQISFYFTLQRQFLGCHGLWIIIVKTKSWWIIIVCDMIL